MNRTQMLIKKAKEMGFDTDEVVYSICLGDIIEVISEILEEEGIQKLTEDKFREVIKAGIKACEYIDWSSVEYYLYEKVSETTSTIEPSM